MKNDVFNHDRFNTWQTCPKKYYFKYIKEIKYPEFHQDYQLGNSVHALIDYYLRGLNIQHLLQNADEEILKNWESIKNHPILNKKLIKTEWSFNTKLGNTPHWLIGRIDAIFFDEEKNKFIIADWKTGIIPKNVHNNFQHKIYLYAFYQGRKDWGLNIMPENLCFQYFKISPDAVEITEIDFSEEKLLEYEENLEGIIKNIENSTDYPITNICRIKFCQYNEMCSKNYK